MSAGRGGSACLACGCVGDEAVDRGGGRREVWGVSTSPNEPDLGFGLALFTPLKNGDNPADAGGNPQENGGDGFSNVLGGHLFTFPDDCPDRLKLARTALHGSRLLILLGTPQVCRNALPRNA